jgi:hypothetical protein
VLTIPDRYSRLSHDWRAKLWGFLGGIAVCTLGLCTISRLIHSPTSTGPTTIEEWRELEFKWSRDPLHETFFPATGASAGINDPLLKVARIYKQGATGTGHSWLVTRQGEISDMWNYGFDAGGESDLGRVPVDILSRLPSYLGRLPASRPSKAGVSGLIVFAFQQDGVWALRRYARDSVPEEADELARLLNVRSSFNHSLVDHWGW